MRSIIYSTTHCSAEEEISSKVVKELSQLWIASSVIYRKDHENVHDVVFQHKKSSEKCEDNGVGSDWIFSTLRFEFIN